jgi:hypothetical protein
MVILLCAGYAVYLFRYNIFRYSAESLIKKNLPDNITVEDINFDIERGFLEILGFRVLNPPGYTKKYFCHIRRFICEYENIGSNLTDGITVTDITAEYPGLYIERKVDGKNNFQEIVEYMQSPEYQDNFKFTSGREPDIVTVKGGYADEVIAKKETLQGNFITEKISAGLSQFNVFDFLELTDTIKISEGQFIFRDMTLESDYQVSLDDVNGTLRFIFNDDYTEFISLETKGASIINGYRDQRLKWVSILYPGREELTMSNSFSIDNIDIRQFKPYYDRYLPIDIINARASGNFVIDFDNGNIGSTNTVSLQGLKFVIKKDTSSSRYWEGAFNEIVKYLTSARGETIFDFKIKGSIKNPRFYPGSHVKEAIQNMVVDKISETVRALRERQQEQGASDGTDAKDAPQPSRPKTDAEKVVELINVFLEEY